MQNILETLFSGEIRPIEQIVLNDVKYKEQTQQQIKILDALLPTLTKEQNYQLEKYLNQANDIQSYLYQKIFRQGFSIGVQILIEGLIEQL